MEITYLTKTINITDEYISSKEITDYKEIIEKDEDDEVTGRKTIQYGSKFIPDNIDNRHFKEYLYLKKAKELSDAEPVGTKTK